MSSVTEAPRWRHAGAALRREPRLALRRSARIELVSADSRHLSFAGRQAALAPLFLCPLLLALGSLPWLAPRPDVVRAATSCAFVAAACAVAAWAWPRRRRLSIVSRTTGPNEASNSGVLLAQPDKLRWVLDAEYAPNELSAGYTVALEPDDGGSSYTVLQSPDPERLLWQFSEILRHWPAPVDCRWGLPNTARPWSVDPCSGPRVRGEGAERAVVSVPLAHRPLIWCAYIIAALVITDLVFLVTSASAGLAHVHPLSVALALAFAICFIALALGLGTGGWRLRIGACVRREITVLGVRGDRGGVRLESVRGVYALGVAAAEQWHVLVDSADGPLALPVPRRDALAIARNVERAIALARSG